MTPSIKYSLDFTRSTICLEGQHCSMRGPTLGKTINVFSSLMCYITFLGTTKFSQRRKVFTWSEIGFSTSCCQTVWYLQKWGKKNGVLQYSHDVESEAIAIACVVFEDFWNLSHSWQVPYLLLSFSLNKHCLLGVTWSTCAYTVIPLGQGWGRMLSNAVLWTRHAIKIMNS